MRFYYKSEDSAVYLENNELKITPFLEMPSQHSFELFANYDCTEDGLRQFASDMIGWNEELKAEKYDFLEKFNNRTGIWLYFKSKATIALKKYTFEAIQENEYEMIEGCYNGGSIYFNQKYKNIPTQCFGYDAPRYYPNLLCDKMLQLPLTQGTQKTFTETPTNFEYGIYKCRVICTDANIQKIFSFSKKNTYTSISLNNAIYLRDKKKFNILIEMVNEPNNALIYENTIDCKIIFDRWLKSGLELRNKYPKNKLAKYMLSSLWGELIRYNQKIVSDYSEIDDIDEYIIHDEVNMANRDVIYLLPRAQIYKNNLARLKPFLVALGRFQMCNIILKHKIIDNIIRIQTDGIVLNKECNFKGDYKPAPEDKTTGIITWYHVNSNDILKAKQAEKKKNEELYRLKMHMI